MFRAATCARIIYKECTVVKNICSVEKYLFIHSIVSPRVSGSWQQFSAIEMSSPHNKGLWVYVDSLYSTYLVVQIRLSYDDSIYLVIEIMTYDKEFFMKDKKKEEKVKIHVQR